ncbi:MAG: CHAT domain-containing protein, partial [Myxococcota bacterium]|nr:CHAT domain-containing protein [Myxococcota bacterium]
MLWEANEAMNQATLALQEGDAAAARTRMEEARSLLGEGATFEHAGYLLALEGELALVEGKPSTALARFDRLQGVEGRWSARWWADFGRARALAAAGRDSDADEAFERALDALEGGAAALDPLVGRPYFLGDRDEVYDRYLLHLLDRGRVTEAFAVSERSRTRATRRDRGLVRGTDEELGGLLDRVVLARAALREHEEGEAFVGPEGRGAWEGDRRDRIDALVRAQAALAAAERERVPGETSPTDPAAEAVAAVGQLGSSARLLAYHATASELVLFAVGGSGIVAFREPVGRLDLEAGVDVWRIAVGAGGGDPAADALGDLLLPAELERIPDGLLVIAPHGPLHGLSFPLLRRDGRFLVEDHPLSMVPGASALTAALASPPCTGGGAVVAADPDGDLRFAREEGRDVASRSEGAELLLGDQIDSAAVREALARACSFHFAGHAVVDPDLPQHSHLRLAGGDRLTWIDLQSLEVRPDLVVLSACETGRGMTPAAGERWGLATGFLAAGASTVV